MERAGKGNRVAAQGYWKVPTPWRLLNSMSFVIGLLVALVIVSAAGVIVPQGAPDAAYLQKYGDVVGRLILLFGADHLFRVWWYVALWGVVVASLVVCSLNRLPFISRTVFGRPLLAGPADFKTYELNASIRLPMPGPEAMSQAKRLLKRRRFKWFQRDGRSEGLEAALAHKGSLERLGPFITHLSIALVLVGGMLASLAGSRHHQPAYPGQSFEVPDLSYKESAGFHLGRILGRTSERELIHEEMSFMDWRGLPDIPEKEVSFSLRVDDFEIERTADGMIADYKTTATVLDPDSVLTRVIEVNEPLVYEGYHFYQSSYGYASRALDSVHLLVTDKEGQPVGGHLNVPFDTPVPVPETQLTVVVSDFIADFVYDIETRTATSRSDEHRNPAVLIEVYRRGEKQFEQWLMMRGMGAHSSKDEGYDFRIAGYEPVMYTVLEVRKHPMINVIWAGFAATVVGICLSFYVTQRRIWVGVLERGPRESEVFLAASSRKDKETFRRYFENLLREMKGVAK